MSKLVKQIDVTDPSGLSGYSNPTMGLFVVVSPTNDIRWMGRCRVEFEWDLKKNEFYKRVGFKKDGMNLDLVKSFWSEIFRKLGRRSRFTICKSNLPNICIIDLPKFWNETDTARSLFSLFLRASIVYHKAGNDVLTTLKSYDLATKALPAIEWFLKGNTVPTYEKLSKWDFEGYTGFIAEFQNLTQAEIENKLVPR